MPRPGAAGRRWSALAAGLLALAGVTAAVVAAALRPADTRSAAAQAWPAFVLVAGLLLIGEVANDDGLFAAAGHWLARRAPTGVVLFLGAAVLVGLVTAVLNLDTSVAFMTPVLVYTARRRGEGEGALLALSILLANAGSLLLPGSNLTNLIVLGHRHLTGGQFLAHLWAPALAATLVTVAVVAGFERRSIVGAASPAPSAAPSPAPRGVGGSAGMEPGSVLSGSPTVRPLGPVAVVLATVLVLALHNPAPAVAVVGVVVIGVRVAQRRDTVRHALDVLGVPVLVGLFGAATALGALGRAWSGPAHLLGHLGAVGTAAVAAGAAVVVNNLPGASLLAARPPPHPFELLVGLNLGPNLLVTGSLAWFLWWRAAGLAGVRPSLRRVLPIGLVAGLLAMVAALGALALAG